MPQEISGTTRRIAYFAEYLALPKSQGTYLQKVSCEHTASKFVNHDPARTHLYLIML